MANLSYKLSSYKIGTTRIVNPGHLYPQDLNLMQTFQREAFSSFCIQSIRPGIVSNLNPIFNLEGSSLYTTVSGTQFTVKPGKAIFQDGVVFTLNQETTFTLDIPFSQDSSYILFLKKTETDTATRYNSEIQAEEIVERGWAFSFDILPVGTFLPLSKMENNNMILLAQMLVDLTQQNYSILASPDASLQRPWFSLVDKEHRSKVGTGIINESNPHGMSINDLDGLPGLSYYEQQDLIGVVSTISGPNHHGDLSKIYIPDATLANVASLTTTNISYIGVPAWSPSTSYVVGQKFYNGNVYYQVLSNYTSGTAFGEVDTANISLFQVTLADASLFQSSGTCFIGNQIYTYTGKSGNTLTGLSTTETPIDIVAGAQVSASPDGYAVYAYTYELPTGAAHILSVIDSENSSINYVFKYDRSTRRITIYSPTTKPWSGHGLYCNCLVIHAGLVLQRNGSGSVLEITQPADGEYIVTPGGVVSTLQMTEYDLEPLSGVYSSYDLMVDPSGMLYPDPYPLIQTSILSLKNQPAMSEVYLQVSTPINIALTNFKMPTFTADDLLKPFLVLKVAGKLDGVEQECTYNIYANELTADAKSVTDTKVVNATFVCPAGVDLKADNRTVSQWIQPYLVDSQPKWSYIRKITIDQASEKLPVDTGLVIQYDIKDSNSIPLASFTLSKNGSILSLSDIREQRIFFEKADGEILYENFHNPLNFNPVLTKYVGRGLENGYWESKPLRLVEGTYRLVLVFDSYKDAKDSVKISIRKHLSDQYVQVSQSDAEITSNKKIYPLALPHNPGATFWDSWYTFKVEAAPGTRVKALWVLTTVDLSAVVSYLNFDHTHSMDKITGLIAALALKANVADVPNKNNVYTKAETYSRLETYAKSEVYNRSEIDAKLVGVGGGTHSIGDINGLQGALDSKAPQANTYTKAEVDAKVSGVVTVIEVGPNGLPWKGTDGTQYTVKIVNGVLTLFA